MKKIVLSICICSLLLVSCKKESNRETIGQESNLVNYEMFGRNVVTGGKDVLSASDMLTKFKNLQEGDTLNVKFASTIVEVCQKKGCWMNVDLGNDEQTFVKFKDYEFFAPMDAKDHKVILDGKAFISVVSIDDLKHYAKDAGKSDFEIEQITEPEVTYSFVANGIAIDSNKGEKK
ncbi:MAG: DUF4920 domain-containing protein [Flavobacteriaceae bacterium]|jgi:hypothetical protein|nr:DUF4920 domain-containing protein [Flavobacteriaceae bacterium]